MQAGGLARCSAAGWFMPTWDPACLGLTFLPLPPTSSSHPTPQPPPSALVLHGAAADQACPSRAQAGCPPPANRDSHGPSLAQVPVAAAPTPAPCTEPRHTSSCLASRHPSDHCPIPPCLPASALQGCPWVVCPAPAGCRQLPESKARRAQLQGCGGSQGWHGSGWAMAGRHAQAEAPLSLCTGTKGITGRKSIIGHPVTWYPQPRGHAVKGVSRGLPSCFSYLP